MSDAPRPRPRAFRLDELEPGQSRDFVLEARPDAYEAEAALLADPAERATEEAQTSGFLRGASFGWAGLLLSSLGGLAAFSFGLWLDQLVELLFARSPALGFIGLGLAGLALLALGALVGRETLAILRQRKVALLHKALALAHETDDREMARRKVGELVGLYHGRQALAAASAHLSDLRREIVDGRDLIEIAERQLMPALDAEARREIADAAKRVSLVSAISPRASVDLIVVAAQALRLIRRIAEIYGGRPGLLGAWRLARAVGAHLAITGGMALTDGLAQQIIGHGLAAKISARLGEGVVNGTLTARIGLSAISVCRPMPFSTEKAPGLGDVAPFLFSNSGKSGENPAGPQP